MYSFEATFSDGVTTKIHNKVFFEYLLNQNIYKKDTEKHCILKWYKRDDIEYWAIAFDTVLNAKLFTAVDNNEIFPLNSAVLVGRETESLILVLPIFRMSSPMFNFCAAFAKGHLCYYDNFTIDDYTSHKYEDINDKINQLHNKFIQFMSTLNIVNNYVEKNIYDYEDIIEYTENNYKSIIKSQENPAGIMTINNCVIIYCDHAFIKIEYDKNEYTNYKIIMQNQLDRLIRMANSYAKYL